jgi:hypothetical protein
MLSIPLRLSLSFSVSLGSIKTGIVGKEAQSEYPDGYPFQHHDGQRDVRPVVVPSHKTGGSSAQLYRVSRPNGRGGTEAATAQPPLRFQRPRRTADSIGQKSDGSYWTFVVQCLLSRRTSKLVKTETKPIAAPMMPVKRVIQRAFDSNRSRFSFRTASRKTALPFRVKIYPPLL